MPRNNTLDMIMSSTVSVAAQRGRLVSANKPNERTAITNYSHMQGRIQDLKKGGGHNTLFLGPPPASKVAQVP